MKTFILMWNPAISNFKKNDYEDLFGGFSFCDYSFSWSIWDYNQVEIGDRFFMARVGDGNTGILMSGKIVSLPNVERDWSGRGRKVYYADLVIDYMFPFADKPPLTTAELAKELPGFEWDHGHSGRVLPKEMEEKLEELWSKAIEGFPIM